MELKFKYKITEEDYIEFCKYNIKKHIKLRHILSIFISSIVLTIALSDIRFLLINIVYLIILTMFYIIYLKDSKKNYKTSKHLQDEIEIIINKEELSVKTINVASSLKLEKIYKIGENNNYLYIFIDKLSAYIVPKEVMTKEEEEKLREILKTFVKFK